MNEELRPDRYWRQIRAPEFWLLFAVVLAALLEIAWWITLPLAIAGLAVSTLPKFSAHWLRARAVGAERDWWKRVAHWFLRSVGASIAAFALGHAVGYVFF